MERQRIERAQKGDRDAFLDLLAQHDRQIMSVIFRFCGDLYDREDLYQEIFLQCWLSLKNYRFQSSFRTWLYRVAFNRCIDFMRKQKPRAQLPEGAQPPPNLERRAKLSAIHNALSRLKGPQRICFHLYYVEQWSLEEITDLLGRSEGTVKSHLNRARAKIKQDHEVLLWQTNPS